MTKKYKVIEEYNVDSFEDKLNELSQDGYAVVSHSITLNSVNNNSTYSAILVSYKGILTSGDYIEQIMDKLDMINRSI